MVLPQLIVFDLDFTLWDCGGSWCDCLTPPFRWERQRLLDNRNAYIQLFPDVSEILQSCRATGTPLAIASRTQEPTWARQLLVLLEIDSEFQFSEIYPSSKVRHFEALRSRSGLEYNEMLFFDDEMRNIEEVGELGVTCVYLEHGISNALFREGLLLHGEKRKQS